MLAEGAETAPWFLLSSIKRTPVLLFIHAKNMERASNTKTNFISYALRLKTKTGRNATRMAVAEVVVSHAYLKSTTKFYRHSTTKKIKYSNESFVQHSSSDLITHNRHVTSNSLFARCSRPWSIRAQFQLILYFIFAYAKFFSVVRKSNRRRIDD